MLIKNGTIIDGTGKERFKSDIRIEGEIIKDISKNLQAKQGEFVINAENKFVTPGFVDIINRSDTHFALILRPGLNSIIKQGVTTIIGGSCGASLAPLVGWKAILAIQKWQDMRGININWTKMSEFLSEIDKKDIAANFATVTGYGTLRRGVAGDTFRRLSSSDLGTIEYLLEQSIAEGSFGMSIGLEYSHEKLTSFAELVNLAKILKKKNCLCAIHLRDEGENLVVSVNEVIMLARETGVSCHIYHFKACGEKYWSQFKTVLEMINGANNSGTDITFDVYPYTRTATVLYLLLPEWVSGEGKAKVLTRIKNKYIRERIKEEMMDREDLLSEIVLSSGGVDNFSAGKSIGEIAKASETSVIDSFLNVIVASNDRAIGFLPTINEENIDAAIKSKYSFIASDGAGYSVKDRKKGALVHPRSFGSFVRFLAKFVRDKNLLEWEEAIKKITFMPARSAGLVRRGVIAKGFFADIVIFSPKNLKDLATFKDPFQYSEGIDFVIVNGGISLKNGKFQKKKYGNVLRK